MLSASPGHTIVCAAFLGLLFVCLGPLDKLGQTLGSLFLSFPPSPTLLFFKLLLYFTLAVDFLPLLLLVRRRRNLSLFFFVSVFGSSSPTLDPRSVHSHLTTHAVILLSTRRLFHRPLLVPRAEC